MGDVKIFIGEFLSPHFLFSNPNFGSPMKVWGLKWISVGVQCKSEGLDINLSWFHSPIIIYGSPSKIWDLQWKSGNHNENMGSPMESLGSPTKYEVSYEKIWVSDEKIWVFPIPHLLKIYFGLGWPSSVLEIVKNKLFLFLFN